jgi:hypothetical protein
MTPIQQPTSPASDATPCSTIFVIVWASYSNYRFQDNLGAATSLEAAREIATREAKQRGCGGHLPVIEDAEKSQDMDLTETPHIWIEAFPANTPAPPPQVGWATCSKLRACAIAILLQ